MYYLSTVIDKLVTPDSDVRRADRHHAVQRAAQAKRTHGEPGAGSAEATD